MLSFQTIFPDTLELLKELTVQPELRGMRLVGGTALALQYGHRQSIDLDFFGTLQATPQEVVQMFHRLEGTLTVLQQSEHIIQVLFRGVKVDVVDYCCYQWIDEPVLSHGLVLASPVDIAALKINAIQGRGSKKDFVDMYVLLHHYSLQEILTFYHRKYPEYSDYRALLSLAYFDDADEQVMPTMFIPDTWELMKAYISDAVRQYQQ